MSILKRQPRPESRPTLRQRLDALTASASRLIRREVADPDPGRRAVMVGAAASAVALPLPVLAGTAAPVALPIALPTVVAAAAVLPGPHPDQALFDAEAACARTSEAVQVAQDAYSRASRSEKLARGPCPEALILSPWEMRFVIGPVPGHTGFRRVRTAIVVPEGREGEHRSNQHAWTAEGLRSAIQQAPAVLGRAGQTPRLIRSWRDLLPMAEAYDARRAGVEAFFCTRELAAVLREAESASHQASAALGLMKATTLEGLAIKVRRLQGASWQSMGDKWATLLESAAAVSGVALRAPEFDAAAWAAAFEAAGGQIVWQPGPAEWWAVQPLHGISPEQQQVLKELSSEYDGNRLPVRRWLLANRAV